MQLCELGKTGIKISRISLGTVELGLDYGVGKKDQSGKPDENTAIFLLHKALASGINLFDTAPGYGCSEEILGKALKNKDNCIIATKVSLPPDCENPEKSILLSLMQSCKKLQRDNLDIVQIHNATVDTFLNMNVFDILANEKDKGNIRFIGASVYEEKDALAGINTGMMDVLQIAYNLLDQRVRYKVLDIATKESIGILARSVFFKGALTKKINKLPENCDPLKKHIQNIINKMGLKSLDELPSTALKFVLSTPQVSSALIGLSSEKHLDSALDAEKEGMLNNNELSLAYECAINEEFWLDPLNWSMDC